MVSPLALLTGASGFAGRHILRHLLASGYRVRAPLRQPVPLAGAEVVPLGDLAAMVDWAPLLAGVSHVVHCAGIAHTSADDAAYARINTQATLELGRAAMAAGVQRLVFLSSIRAISGPGNAEVLTDAALPCPTDAYGRSKLAAEQGLAAMGAPLVALRPVVMVGTCMAGNMGALARLARVPLPLPLSGFHGQRSLIGIDNLCESVNLVLSAPQAVGRSFIVADDEALDVGQIIAEMRAGIGFAPRLFALPPALLRAVATLAGRSDMLERLEAPLVARADGLKALGWVPRQDIRAAIRAAMRPL